MRTLQAGKLGAIEHAYRLHGIRSFADLGAIGKVYGGYSFHTIRKRAISHGYLVDVLIDDWVHEHARRYPNLTVIEDDFAGESVRARIGRSSDAVFLFDVLLHTVDPDWDALLEAWAPLTRCFVIGNPQWHGSPDTTRLIELGRESYLETVPPTKNHSELFDRLDDRFEPMDRPFRDAMHVWQWGITDRDLIAKLEGLGFAMTHHARHSPFWGARDFTNTTFVFARDE
jgi:hypothetical protein